MSTAAAQARPVDLAHLARYTGGDSALNAEVLQLFHDQSLVLLRELEQALQTADQKRWREITHSLKGAARAIGAFGLAEAAAQAEPVTLGESAAAAQVALAALAARGRAVQVFIAAYLG